MAYISRSQNDKLRVFSLKTTYTNSDFQVYTYPNAIALNCDAIIIIENGLVQISQNLVRVLEKPRLSIKDAPTSFVFARDFKNFFISIEFSIKFK